MFAGKTDTFNVNVTNIALPTGYTRYGYIESIHYEVVPKAEYKHPDNFIYLNSYDDMNTLSSEFTLGCKPGVELSTPGVCGARLASGSSTPWYGLYLKEDGVSVQLRNTTQVVPWPSDTSKFKVTIDNKETSPYRAKINNGSYVSKEWTAPTSVIPYGMSLFNNIPNGSTSNMSFNVQIRIGEIVFRKYDGECVGYYIPVVYENKIGMYDVMTQTFCTAKIANAVTLGNSDCLYNVGNFLLDETIEFVNKTNITDTNIVTKLNDMVLSLKQEGLWNKIDALYPCVGTTFTQMSYNLKNPNKYQLSTTGTTTIVDNVSVYTTSQIKSNNPDYIPVGDFHLIGASGTTLSNVGASFFAIGPTNAGGTNGGILTLWQANAITVKTENNTSWKADITNKGFNGDDFIIASLTSGIVCNGQDLQAVKTGEPSITSWTNGTDKYMIHNGYNYSNENIPGKLYSPYIMKISGFGKGLSIEEMLKYSEIINTFKTMY